MKKTVKLISVLLVLVLAVGLLGTFALADEAPAGESEAALVSAKEEKGLYAAVTIAIVAAVGAAFMGIVISNSVKSVARQPEAASKIQSLMMLGLVFLETAIIYALIIAILIIFVL